MQSKRIFHNSRSPFKKSFYFILLLIIVVVIIISERKDALNIVGYKDSTKFKDAEFYKAYFCATDKRVAFDEYLSKNGKYDYLKADTNLYEPDRREMMLIEKIMYSNQDRIVDLTRKRKYFFSMNFYNNEDIIPFIIEELMLLFKFLGPENIFLSVYENSSTDNTKKLLYLFSSVLDDYGLKHRIIIDPAKRPNDYDSIRYLSNIRNKALEPLKSEEELGNVYDKIVFMDSVLFCHYDILELLYQSDYQGSDLTGPYDYLMTKDPKKIEFRGGWIARDLDGHNFTQIEKGYVNHGPSVIRFEEWVPTQVQCTWSGVSVVNAKPFYGKTPIRFRVPDIENGDCPDSERNLLCSDLWKNGFGRAIIVPRILLSYSLSEARFLENNYELIMGTNLTQKETVDYTDGPFKIYCSVLEKYIKAKYKKLT
ncbi:Alpha-1,3-mannosyltransferase CMT1 [Smittium culicis]|uniref:Alpha-1,3-mannosyltransferase CMT1 n=1 Tax=Smittium culicis TaxID=133412 RepID=A0A1R1YKI3_9FUNG|nr:Alpha-1,3-mannosyltransferase CMT1 [Smittium culicis]